MRKIAAIFGVFVTLLMSGIFAPFVLPSIAGVTCSLPFNLTNGTTADASQVMANYNALVTCMTNAAAAGANNDITSLSGLTTPLTPTQGGSNVYIGSTPTVSGAELIIASTTPANFANTKGYSVIFAATATNAGATTINVNGQGIVNLYKQSTAGPVPLTGSELYPNQLYMATFDGTEFQINPVPSVAAGWGLAQNASATAIQINATNPPYGFDTCINLQLSASNNGTLLTVAVKAADTGSDPSATHPVLCSFRDPTIANGGPKWVAITSALSMNTNAANASLGTQNGVAFKLWVVIYYNGGTPALGLWQSVTWVGGAPTSIGSLDEASLVSPTAISAAASSAATFYSPNGSSISNSPFRILGHMEYANGLATAGTYASNPTKIQLFGAGIKKPGDRIQTAYATNTSGSSCNSTSKVETSTTVSITPTSKANLIRVHVDGQMTGGAASAIAAQISRCTSPTLIGSLKTASGSITGGAPVSLSALDLPQTTSSQLYAVYIWNSTGSGTSNWMPSLNGATEQSTMFADELMT